jgi:hypothetical protein
LKRSKTTKLFFNKYLYRLTLKSSHAQLFRSADKQKLVDILEKAQHIVDSKDGTGRDGHFTVPAIRNYMSLEMSANSFNEAKRINQQIDHLKDPYMIRVQRPVINIYSNNNEELLKIARKLENKTVIAYCAPDAAYLAALIAGKVLVTRDLKEFNYRVALHKVNDFTFVDWVQGQPDRFKISDAAARQLREGVTLSNSLIYVRDKKMLTMLHMRLDGNSLGVVHELVHQ